MALPTRDIRDANICFISWCRIICNHSDILEKAHLFIAHHHFLIYFWSCNCLSHLWFCEVVITYGHHAFTEGRYPATSFILLFYYFILLFYYFIILLFYYFIILFFYFIILFLNLLLCCYSFNFNFNFVFNFMLICDLLKSQLFDYSKILLICQKMGQLELILWCWTQGVPSCHYWTRYILQFLYPSFPLISLTHTNMRVRQKS